MNTSKPDAPAKSQQKQPNRALTVSVSPILIGRLRVVAAARDCSLSQVVAEVLGAYVAEHVEAALKAVASGRD